nr:protein phosphatase Slingshot homolog 1-like [Microcebus murinus]
MALVTLQRSPTPSAASSSASNSELETGSDEDRKLNLSLSESFFMVKGAALFLQQGSSAQGQRCLQHPHKHAGDGSKLMLLFYFIFFYYFFFVAYFYGDVDAFKSEPSIVGGEQRAGF